jgi:urea transport system permease protein
MIVRLLLLLFVVCSANVASADALDDTLAKFIEDKFPQTSSAVGELAISGSPIAVPILEALRDNRLLIDPVSHALLYRNGTDEVVNARTGEKISGIDATTLKKVRVNNALRSSIDAALGSLTLANPDPAKRFAAAEAVFKSRDPKALTAVQTALAKETNPRAAAALRDARAAILALDPAASTTDRMEAVEMLKSRGDQDAQGLLDELAARADTGELKAAAQAALESIKTRLAIWSLLQNIWYGVSASSVLLLAAIGLAITFGVMGVINMAHGEMVMLGAYTTFVVQSLLPSWLSQWSLAISLPLAFVVAGAVGVLIER